MEIESQNEPLVAEEQLSPTEQLQRQWKQQPGFISFVRQKNVIDQNAELLPYANRVALPGWASPRAFAFEGLVIVAIILSIFNWYQTRHRGRLEEEILAVRSNVATENKRQQGIMDATRAERKRIQSFPKIQIWNSIPRDEALQQLDSALEDSRKSLQQYEEKMAAREKELRAQQEAQAVARSGAPLLFSIALILAAGLVAAGVRRDFPRSNVRFAGDYYLFLATAYGLWPNLVLLLLLHFALSGSAYGLTGLSDTMGPLFWIVFWAGFYFLLIRYMGVVARDMYKSLQIRPPASEWSLDNRMLVRLHNSFLVAVVLTEAAFLSLSYFFYLAARRFV